MKFKFWGVRGSIPVPGASTVRYGGNTTCIEIRTDDDTLIILDGGTGIFALAQTLMSRLPIQANIFLTHTHWDHIHGLPFFLPLFVPGNHVHLYGAFDPVSGFGPEQTMAVQFQYSYFPVREAELKANLHYNELAPGQVLEVGDARVSCVLLNHPVINLGYRVECNGKSVFFTGDYEPPFNIYQPGDPNYLEYQAFVDQRIAEVDHAMRGVDALIVDSSYTREEYPSKLGWGHGSFDGAIAMAKRVGAKHLLCTHHEPTRTDDALEAVFEDLMVRHAGKLGDLRVSLAAEKMEIVL